MFSFRTLLSLSALCAALAAPIPNLIMNDDSDGLFARVVSDIHHSQLHFSNSASTQTGHDAQYRADAQHAINQHIQRNGIHNVVSATVQQPLHTLGSADSKAHYLVRLETHDGKGKYTTDSHHIYPHGVSSGTAAANEAANKRAWHHESLRQGQLKQQEQTRANTAYGHYQGAANAQQGHLNAAYHDPYNAHIHNHNANLAGQAAAGHYQTYEHHNNNAWSHGKLEQHYRNIAGPASDHQSLSAGAAAFVPGGSH